MVRYVYYTGGNSSNTLHAGSSSRRLRTHISEYMQRGSAGDMMARVATIIWDPKKSWEAINLTTIVFKKADSVFLQRCDLKRSIGRCAPSWSGEVRSAGWRVAPTQSFHFAVSLRRRINGFEHVLRKEIVRKRFVGS